MVHKTGQGEERELDRSDISYSLSFNGFFFNFFFFSYFFAPPPTTRKPSLPLPRGPVPRVQEVDKPFARCRVDSSPLAGVPVSS